MSKRSNGRPSRSRGARVEARKTTRAERPTPPVGPTRMHIPDAIRDLTAKPKESDHAD